MKKNPCPTKLEEERHRAKLTRKELSEITGISIRTIEAYEQQKNNINQASVITVKKIATALKIPIEKIID